MKANSTHTFLHEKRFGLRACLIVLAGFLCSLLSEHLWAEPWTILGPDGGDARSLAYDPRNPNRIFLGTDTGTIFLSTDGGRNWSRCAHVGQDDDYVLDHIVIDPADSNTIYISAWSAGNSRAGDLFRSRDGGSTWQILPAMHGKSIRALAISGSSPSVMIAGSLEGVYRSTNAGDSWKRISPVGNKEIKNIESVAVDPNDTDVIYAGTWHLAWKTYDAGATWQPINRGMEDDSDIFSILVDTTKPYVVLASACSGIYRSETAGRMFHKIHGIPFSARRTHVLKQDSSNPKIIFAGTTAGLWKTVDGGNVWRRVTSPGIVVNDVLVDPRDSNRVLLATDRGGVTVSEDGGRTFAPSNHGYAHRYVTAIVADKNDPDTIFVGVANDREWGGVFSFRRGDQHWQQMSKGLGGRDVFSLKQTSKGALVAGTNRGIFILDRNAKQWRPSKTVFDRPSADPVGPTARNAFPRQVGRWAGNTRVNDLDIREGRWVAATSAGLFTSLDEGKTWTGGPILGQQAFISVQSLENLEVVATRTTVVVSTDGGVVWRLCYLPRDLIGIRSVAVTAKAQILVASQGGGFRSSDRGATWYRALNGLPERDIGSITYDEEGQRLLATSARAGTIFESDDDGRSWRRGPDAGYPIRSISVAHGRLLAATPFDGVIAQP